MASLTVSHEVERPMELTMKVKFWMPIVLAAMAASSFGYTKVEEKDLVDTAVAAGGVKTVVAAV